ncbi:MAG: hypothetical protein AAF541_24125 [Pseudomonadota bacterium]
MTPAKIGEHETSLAKTIGFPNVPGNYTTYVRCEAKVMPGGTIDEIGCYGDAEVDPAFFRAVHMGAKSATVTPATVAGNNVNVLMLLTVLFRQQDDQRIIAVIPNHGTNAKEMGMSYIAPQKYGRANQYAPRSEIGLLWVDTKMTAAGKATDTKYLETDFSTKETERYAKRYINDNTFIPGYLNGEATPMRFVKPIFGYRNGFMWDVDASKCRDSAIACDERSNATGKPRYVFDD